MYAIVKPKGEPYYTSLVFGYYVDIRAVDDYERYLESIHNQYYIVLNREKTALIKQCIYDRNNKYLEPLILIVDSYRKDWIIDEKGCGSVNFLPKSKLLQMVENNVVPVELLTKCIEEDALIKYEEYKDIRNETDIKNLEWVSGGFHDAYIKKLEKRADDTLYVLFDGTWGCSIEVWFEGDVQYDVKSRDSNEYDPYWSDSTVIIQDGFVYLIDNEGMTVDKITEGYCWFKAKHMKYHVIPDR